MSIKEDLIFVAIIYSVWGVQGNVLIKSFTTPNINIIKMNLLDESQNQVIVKLIRQNSQGHLICKINGINNRTDAEKLKNYKLFCHRSNFSPLNDDEFYVKDLKGLLVLDINLVTIGKIVNIFNFGAGDIIEIKFTQDRKTELFPFIKEFFPVINQNYAIFTRT